MMIAAEAGVSVVVPPGITDPVSLSLVDTEAEDGFRQLAAAMGLSVSYRDGVVTYVKGRALARSAVVFPLGFDVPSELTEVCKAIVGDAGVVSVVGGRLVVVGAEDSTAVLADVVDQLKVGPDGWTLEVRVIQLAESLREQLGVGMSIDGKASLSGTLRAGPMAAPGSAVGLVGAGTLEALFKAVADGSQAKLVTRGTMFLLEGSPAVLKQGDRVPLAKKVVSDQGTVSTTSYDFIDTGFTLEAEGQRVPQGLLLKLSPTLSSVTGYVGDAPIQAQRSMSGSVVVRSGDWVLLSGLDSADWSRSSSGLPGRAAGLGGAQVDSAESRSVVVLVRAVRVFASGGGQ